MRGQRTREAGFTYLGLLAAVALMGLLLSMAARVWAVTEQREREEQLLFAGDAIRLAISSYYAHGHRYPNTLKDLLGDDRSPVPLHHLRRLYLDPMTNGTDWQLVHAPDGGIKGVYSASQLAPIKRRNFSEIDKTFVDSDCYCKWQFVYEPRFRRWTSPLAPGTNPGSPGAPGPGDPGTPTGQ
jgi:type II secretory pathway pseudopilin PulG